MRARTDQRWFMFKTHLARALWPLLEAAPARRLLAPGHRRSTGQTRYFAGKFVLQRKHAHPESISNRPSDAAMTTKSDIWSAGWMLSDRPLLMCGIASQLQEITTLACALRICRAAIFVRYWIPSLLVQTAQELISHIKVCFCSFAHGWQDMIRVVCFVTFNQGFDFNLKYYLLNFGSVNLNYFLGSLERFFVVDSNFMWYMNISLLLSPKSTVI